MKYGPSILCSVLAAMSFAVAAVLQQESTLTVPEDRSLSAKLLTALVRQPKWLAGGAAMLIGFGLQALALSYGPIAVVQPIVVTELAFAIPIGILRRHRQAGQREWAGILLVVSGVSLFVFAASPGNGIGDPGSVDWIASMTPVGLMAAVAVALGATQNGPRRAMLLGAAAGLAFGALSVLTKTVTYLLSHDLVAAFRTWQVYATVAVGIVALIVSQSAYQAGPLAYSMPFVGVLEPLVAVIIGDTVLGEQVRISQGLFALELLAAGLAVLGIVLLTTSQTVLSIYEERRPEVILGNC